MIHVVIGHRGVGKTSFLQRVKYYFEARMQTCHIYDLDQEIEKREGRSITDIFFNHGENYFRELEINVFQQLLREISVLTGVKYIAVGGGFQGSFPPHVQVLWLRRQTDRDGRIFIDRPRLDHDLTPLAEYARRYDSRDKHFREICHRELMMGEGWDFINPFEPALLGLKPANLEVAVTVLPEHVASSVRLQYFLRDALSLGVKFIELRDDLLSEEMIKTIVSEIPSEKVLISFRRSQTSKSLIEFCGSYATDWACELGPSPFAHNAVVSLHTKKDSESVDEACERLLQMKAEHYKLAIPIHDFVELWAGHRFFSGDPEHRSFLPCSQNGRWQWYRLIQYKKMKLNFARYGDGSSLDQPLIFDFLRSPRNANGFAAVLGDPIGHSRTPAEQNDFFMQRRMGTVGIQVGADECDSLNLSILERLGLKAAAVTSPLKKKMRELCAHVDKKTAELGAVNTIVRLSSGWHGTNTDINGIEGMFSTIDLPNDVVIWGGSGTRHVLKAVLPRGHFFSARRGEEIWVEAQKPLSPEIVVWALGRAHFETSQKPPIEWRPRYVMDLNYTENSPGIEYALQVGAKYISGQGLFKTQARAQREFWARGNVLP